MQTTRKNIDSIDLVKGIAAILIVCHHYQDGFSCHFGWINFYGGRINLGYLVELFFIISGFLTVYSQRTDQRKRGFWKSFFRKIMRILPMATLACLAAFIIKLVDAKITNDVNTFNELISLKAIFANFLLLFSGIPGLNQFGYNNPTWYLCILIQCIFIYLLIVHYVKNDKYCTIIYLLIVLFITVLQKFVQYETYRGFQAFFLGALLCKGEVLLKSTQNGDKAIRRYKYLLLLLIIGTLVAELFFMNGRGQREILMAGFFIPLVFLITYDHQWKNPKAGLFGKVSFEVYIWHSPIISLIQLLIHKEIIPVFTHTYISVIIFFVMIEILAVVMYFGVERPINGKLARIQSSDK